MNRIIPWAVAAALGVILSGCDEDERQFKLRFSHYLHVEDMEMACEDCHGEPGSDGFMAITHDTCLACHEEPDAEEISEDTCGICHQPKEVALFSMPDLDKESGGYEAADEPASLGIFVHHEALTGRCKDCHESLLSEDLETVPELKRSDILVIRESAHGSGQACATCHEGLDRDIAPPSHDVAWNHRHGQFGMQEDASCNVCHTEDSCRECHSIMQPTSHNNLFRMRTHGAMAQWDRTSCMVCHQEESCTSCHASTRPRSHNARWGASGMRPTHCIGCHDTSTAGDGCVTCHEGGNDVMLHAQYWSGAPINHNQPGIANCYTCHWMQTP